MGQAVDGVARGANRKPSRGGTARGALGRGCLVVGVVVTLLGGCATVAPYERERLAQQDMQLGRSPDARAGSEHALAYREGSTGAMGGSGGGCGCN